jgi:hypothetical protein
LSLGAEFKNAGLDADAADWADAGATAELQNWQNWQNCTACRTEQLAELQNCRTAELGIHDRNANRAQFTSMSALFFGARRIESLVAQPQKHSELVSWIVSWCADAYGGQSS